MAMLVRYRYLLLIAFREVKVIVGITRRAIQTNGIGTQSKKTYEDGMNYQIQTNFN